MGPFASVQFGMSFQVMEAAKPRIAGLAHIWLLVTVSEEMALEIVVSGEFRRAVGTSVLFIRGLRGLRIIPGESRPR